MLHFFVLVLLANLYGVGSQGHSELLLTPSREACEQVKAATAKALDANDRVGAYSLTCVAVDVPKPATKA